MELAGMYTENIEETFAREIVKTYLNSGKKEFVVVNIGTDKCIGDCLAPMVGTILDSKGYPNIEGTLDNPIHALNIATNLSTIEFKYENPFILGIDACIGDSNDIGKIQLRSIPLRPGKGVGKSLPRVGDMSIVGIVDDAELCTNFVQRPIRLSFIVKLAERIAKCIEEVYGYEELCIEDKEEV